MVMKIKMEYLTVNQSNLKIMKILSLIHVALYLLMLHSCTRKAQPTTWAGQVDAINIHDFGAIPNDGKDDSEAIQKAINNAITKGKSSVIFCPSGTYDLSTGLIISNKNNNGEYNYVTVKLIGAVQAYSPNQKIGKVTVFKYNGKGFTLALQSARNCVIENIMFEGGFDYTKNFDDNMYQAGDEIWTINFNANKNAYSPSCAIAIDPFHKDILFSNRYDKLSTYYTNKSNSGSSMVLIRGCSFFKQFIAIANGVSGYCMNGDNVRAENCHAQVCYNFWSSGQDQSRANSIENLYAYNIHRLIDGVSIGQGRGTPPTLSHVNFAGISKELFRINTGFSGIMAHQCYFENLYTIGIINANLASFQQCQFKFRPASNSFYKSSYLLRSNTIVTFRDCSLEYFSNYTDKSPFILLAKKLIIDGGQIEGGLPVPEGITALGGGHIQNVVLKNVNMKCENTITADDSHILNHNIGKIIGEVRCRKENLKNLEGIYSCYAIERVSPIFNEKLKTVSFNSKNVHLYRIGDNLFTDSDILFGDGTSTRASLGFVSNIDDQKVTVSGISKEVNFNSFNVYIVDYNRITPDLQYSYNKNTKSIFVNKSVDMKWLKVGMRLNLPELNPGTYITEIKDNQVFFAQ